MRYRLTAPATPLDPPGRPRKQAWVTLQAPDRESPGRLEFAGDPLLVARVRDALLASYGFRGRFIEEETTPMDLEIAMTGWQMEPFAPERDG